jgi:hypothetical protein
MSPLRLTSEPYSPGGSVPGSTLTRAITNTSLDEWSVLLRETLQNSVDARTSDSAPINFRVAIEYANPGQKKCLREQIFAEPAKSLAALERVIKRDRLPLLTIADWGTRGLGGPIRADVVTNDRTDFCDFFLNVGREDAKKYQGGTWGLGRGVLFDISEPGAIVVFTRTASGGRPVTRLMAMAIGQTYNTGGFKFTGRHWWGADSASQWAEPVTGRQAEGLAAQLGLDVIPTGQTGTAIMVVAPRIPVQHDLSHVLDAMIESAHLYGWPLMVGRRGKPAVTFEFGVDGGSWVPLSPEDAGSRVRAFVDAYRVAESTSPPEVPTSWQHRLITFGSGQATPKPLGTLAFRHLPPAAGAQATDDDDALVPIAAVALMRDPRMVVRYLPVPKHPLGSSTVGVFIAETHFDHDFAESEPVAHDDWIPSKLDAGRFARNPVKQALEKIKKSVKDSWNSAAPLLAPGSGPDGLAPVIGDLLGGLVVDTPGSGVGGGGGQGGGGGGGGRRSSTARATVGAPTLRLGRGGEILAAFPVQVIHGEKAGKVALRANPRVVLDGGTEAEGSGPAGGAAPAVVGWEDIKTGTSLSTSPKLDVDPGVSTVLVLVHQPPDTAVTVGVEVDG